MSTESTHDVGSTSDYHRCPGVGRRVPARWGAMEGVLDTSNAQTTTTEVS